jgi:hypothetical protein
VRYEEIVENVTIQTYLPQLANLTDNTTINYVMQDAIGNTTGVSVSPIQNEIETV